MWYLDVEFYVVAFPVYMVVPGPRSPLFCYGVVLFVVSVILFCPVGKQYPLLGAQFLLRFLSEECCRRFCLGVTLTLRGVGEERR